MSIPAAAARADAAHIQVLLVGIGHYPHLPGSDLLGTQGDVELWHGLLARMGIPMKNMWLAASPLDDPAEEAQTVAHLLSTLPPGQVCGDGTRDGIQALVEAFVARLADPASQADRALVVWAGHGYAAPDGTLALATADTAEVGDGPLQDGGSFTGLLGWSDLADLLDRRPRSVGLTLVVDTCFAAAGPGHRSLTRQTSRGRRPELRAARDSDVVLSASLGGQQAREVGMHKLQVGAFSWAVTCVLGRWGQSQQQAGVDISLTSLVARAGALLFAADIDQTPAFDGPVDQGERPFLHPPQDVRVGDSAPEGLPGSEVSPGESGRVYDLISGTTLLGNLVVTRPDKRLNGVEKNRLWWSTIPTGTSFTLATSGAAGTEGTLYEAGSWSSTKVSDPGSTAGGWSIQTSLTGPVVGYLYQTSTQLVFLRQSGVNYEPDAVFTWISAVPATTTHHRATCPLK